MKSKDIIGYSVTHLIITDLSLATLLAQIVDSV